MTARGGGATGRRALGAAVAAGVAVSVPVAELLAFRRRGAVPVPGPHDLDGTIGGGAADRWVWLGDSLSAGVGAGHADESFPRLTAGIVAGWTGQAVDLRCVAAPGATARDVLALQVPTALPLLASGALAVVAVGCNDALHAARPATFRADYGEVLAALVATGARVLAVGTPDLGSMMSVMPQPLRTLVARAGAHLDTVVQAAASGHGAEYVAIAAAPPFTCATLSPDGWHPNGDGYRMWASLVAGHIIRR